VVSDIEITVQGNFTAYAMPERATVRLRVGHQGPEPAGVIKATTAAAEAVRASVTPLHQPSSGPVTWWSSQQLSTSSHRPWNKDGKQLPLVHSARTDFEVKFSDFAAMGSWLGGLATESGVDVAGIEWALTAARREQLADEVRIAAVKDAMTKARSYASAFGLSTVRAIAVADAGMLGMGLRPEGQSGVAVAHSRAAADPSVSEVQFAPRHIAVTASVDARFIAS
jgi:uncharacterized protein YggE